MYFNTSNKSFYLIVTKGKVYVNNMKHHSSLISVKNGILYYFNNGIKTVNIDHTLIKFQKEFMMGLDPIPEESIRDKVIEFVEGLGYYDKALSFCREDNQRFEILIKLGNLEEALNIANSPIKFKKLGKKFFDQGDMSKAAECFYRTDDINSLLVRCLW
jgi:coatomer subunit beta'